MSSLWDDLGTTEQEREDTRVVWVSGFYDYVFADPELIAPFVGLLARSRPATLADAGRNPIVPGRLPLPIDPGLSRTELEAHVGATVDAVLGRPYARAYDLSRHLEMNLKPAWFFGAHRWFLQSGDDAGAPLHVLGGASAAWFGVATQIVRRWHLRELEQRKGGAL